jgi:hypothetical protein
VPPVDLIGDADPERIDAREDVELVEHDRAHAVDRDRVAQRDRVEPADAAWPAGHRPDLAATLGDPGADPVE